MKENVLDVLMYLFENYMDGEMDTEPDQETLKVELLEAGFPRGEINKAFKWLEDLSERRQVTEPNVQAERSLRVFTSHELVKLDVECRGFLMFLEQSGILTPSSRELAIDRVMALEAPQIELEQLKWVILLVLFNQPGEEAAYAWMEDLVFEEFGGPLH
jgi:Smg protein